MLYQMIMLSIFARSLLTVVGKVAQPPLSVHTAMPRSVIIILSDANVFKQLLRLYRVSDKRATYEIGRGNCQKYGVPVGAYVDYDLLCKPAYDRSLVTGTQMRAFENERYRSNFTPTWTSECTQHGR